MDGMSFDLGKKTDCSCGKEHTAPIDEVIVEKGAVKRLPDIIKRYGAKKAFVISDKNTYKAAGKAIASLFSESGIDYKEFVFQTESVKPNEEYVGSALMHFDASCDIVVGVGSGVINDISKILSNAAGCRYIIVATAPSMDGYASASSSVDMDGLKISLPSRCPDVIIGDIDILKNAPLRMLTAGLGDMVAKYISICEWRISNIITGEYYCPYVADMVRSALKKCVENADGLLCRDENAVKAVFEGLVLGGIAMKYAGLSRPASGVEHYFSHIWDMRGLEFGTPVDFHGIQCAVATLIAARLYEKIKKTVPDREKAIKYAESFDYGSWKNTLSKFLGKGADAMTALEEKEHKYSVSAHKERIEKIISNWDKILCIINEEIPPAEEIRSLLIKIGAPTNVEEIGLQSSLLPLTFKATKDIRDKYVLSRLCFDLGIIDEIEIEED